MMAFEILISQIIYAAISYLWYLKCLNRKVLCLKHLKEMIIYCLIYIFIVWIMENCQLRPTYYLLAMVVSGVLMALILRTEILRMVALLACCHSMSILTITASSLFFYLVLPILPKQIGWDSVYYLPYVISLVVSIVLLHYIHFPEKFYLMLDHYGKLIALINSMLVLLICGLIAFSYQSENREHYWYLLGTMLLIASVLFIYLRDKQKGKITEEKFIELSQKIVSDTHSQKEIQKVLVREYRDLLYCAESLDKAHQMNWDLEEVHKRLKEFQQLHYIAPHSAEDAVYFVQDTGSVILNDMLRTFAEEFAEKEIKFESHTVTKIGELITDEQIPLAKLLELFGDLLRNAMHAVERSREAEASVERQCDDVVHIWMGKQYEGEYHIDICDSGQPFFLEVLEKMGEYGNTTGGTGYGMANLLKTLADYDASFIITEYSVDPAPFTKCITIAFDRKSQLVIESYRYEELLKRADQLPFEIRPLDF